MQAVRVDQCRKWQTVTHPKRRARKKPVITLWNILEGLAGVAVFVLLVTIAYSGIYLR